MNIIINGVKTDKGPLSTSEVKVFINGKEERGIQKIIFEADASRGHELTMVTMELIPDSLYIKGDFMVKEKKADGLNISSGLHKIWVSREAIEDMLNGKIPINPPGAPIRIKPNVVEVGKNSE